MIDIRASIVILLLADLAGMASFDDNNPGKLMRNTADRTGNFEAPSGDGPFLRSRAQ